MLMLVDSGRETAVPAIPAAGRLLRLCVQAPGYDRSAPRALRALLVADLIRRVLEDLHTSPVLLAVLSGGSAAPLPRTSLDALMVRPVIGFFDSIDDAAAELGGAFGMTVTASEDASAGQDSAGLELRVGPVTSDATVAELIRAGHDPMTVRCALLSARYAQPLSLTEERLAETGQTLDRWRRRVAEWSESTSAAMPVDVVEAAHRAYDGDLDVPAVLELMRHVEADAAIAAGAKFEIFVHLDGVLAFDLVRYLGQPS